MRSHRNEAFHSKLPSQARSVGSQYSEVMAQPETLGADRRTGEKKTAAST